jgi:hypothetical protein
LKEGLPAGARHSAREGFPGIAPEPPWHDI